MLMLVDVAIDKCLPKKALVMLAAKEVCDCFEIFYIVHLQSLLYQKNLYTKMFAYKMQVASLHAAGQIQIDFILLSLNVNDFPLLLV